MNQDTCMKVAVYAVIAIVVILVVRFLLRKENFANEHHHRRHHRHHHHENKKHEQEQKSVGNQPLNVGTEYILSPDTDGWMRVKQQQNSNNLGNIMTGNVFAQGSVQVNDGPLILNTNPILFDSPQNNNTDPYTLQKIIAGPNNSSLRLTINDDSDESFQIWGNSCAAGNCGGPGTMQHKFSANGDVIHQGKLIVNEIQIGNAVLTQGDNNSLRITTPTGWTEIGSQNSGWSHIYTDRPAFAFNSPVTDVGRGPYSQYRRMDQ